jgi:hypothetical protein
MEWHNEMDLQCSVLIRIKIKFIWNVILVNNVSVIEGVDSTFSQFKKHNCIQDTEILILLRETNSNICWPGSHTIFLAEATIHSAENQSVFDEVVSSRTVCRFFEES